MARKDARRLVLMVPEGEEKNYKYSFPYPKSKAMVQQNKKLRMRRYDPSTLTHRWFVERRMPAHAK